MKMYIATVSIAAMCLSAFGDSVIFSFEEVPATVTEIGQPSLGLVSELTMVQGGVGLHIERVGGDGFDIRHRRTYSPPTCIWGDHAVDPNQEGGGGDFLLSLDVPASEVALYVHYVYGGPGYLEVTGYSDAGFTSIVDIHRIDRGSLQGSACYLMSVQGSVRSVRLHTFVDHPDATSGLNASSFFDHVEVHLVDIGACTPADLSEPFGILDLSDISSFIDAFTLHQAPADLAEPFGLFDLADVNLFLSSFLTGCPD